MVKVNYLYRYLLFKIITYPLISNSLGSQFQTIFIQFVLITIISNDSFKNCDCLIRHSLISHVNINIVSWKFGAIRNTNKLILNVSFPYFLHDLRSCQFDPFWRTFAMDFWYKTRKTLDDLRWPMGSFIYIDYSYTFLANEGSAQKQWSSAPRTPQFLYSDN